MKETKLMVIIVIIIMNVFLSFVRKTIANLNLKIMGIVMLIKNVNQVHVKTKYAKKLLISISFITLS